MSDKNIPPGPYRLSRDVRNPNADRRCTRDWRKETTWKAGTRFVVVEQRRHALSDEYLNTLGPDLAKRLRENDTYTTIVEAGVSYPSLYMIGPGHTDQYKALDAALVRCEIEAIDQFLTRIDCPDGFVEWMLENNRVSRTDVEKWWHSYQFGDPKPAIKPPVHDESLESRASAMGNRHDDAGRPSTAPRRKRSRRRVAAQTRRDEVTCGNEGPTCRTSRSAACSGARSAATSSTLPCCSPWNSTTSC